MIEKVLVDDLTRFGLRRVHVLGMRRVGREELLERAPVEAVDVRVVEWREEGVGVWHAWVVWKAREVIRLSTNGANETNVKEIKENGEEVLIWWVGEGEKVGELLEEAVGRYRMELGREPSRMLVRKAGKGASLAPLPVEEAGWVPVGFFVLV